MFDLPFCKKGKGVIKVQGLPITSKFIISLTAFVIFDSFRHLFGTPHEPSVIAEFGWDFAGKKDARKSR